MPEDTSLKQVSSYYPADDLRWARDHAHDQDRPLGYVLREALKFYRQDQEAADHDRADQHQ